MGGRLPAKALARRGELTVEEVAEQIGRTPTTVRNYIRETRDGYPRLKGQPRGGYLYVLRSELRRFRKRWPGIRPKAASGDPS